ncbi:nuclear transport factor 2 family protein [Micromonospora musae]|uniref:nuclear transport factor 2 family protein n=1 Tax=Micromonospora musae TaxID=1894970 RepID=UPI0018F60BA5|nr:nuclear transport factor 2 family protein [Micromonospora musae]
MPTQVHLSDALNELALAPTRALDEALDAYYAPDYTHRSDGRTLDRAGFAQMVAGMRERVVSGTVTVLDEFRDGSAYAERHVYEITMADGSTIRREISVFGSYAEDGRFRHLSETGFDLAPDETTPTA